MSKHPLISISRYSPYKERVVDMIGDSMRALLLEYFGYGVNLFEFTAAEQTPKNIRVGDTTDKDIGAAVFGVFFQHVKAPV